jgi:hypothetical protein
VGARAMRFLRVFWVCLYGCYSISLKFICLPIRKPDGRGAGRMVG